MNLLVLRVDGNTSYKETASILNSPSKTIIGPEEEITQRLSAGAKKNRSFEVYEY
jgi:hypothetical protein